MKKRTKNIVALILLIFFVFTTLMTILPFYFADAEEKDYIKIYLNEDEIKADVAPFISNDRVLVPVRMIFESLDAEVEWKSKQKKVIINSEDKEFVFTINSDVAYINDKKYILDVRAQIVNDRTFIPLRFLAENLDMNVEWSDKERCVFISDKVKINYINLKEVELEEDIITAYLDGNEEVEYEKMILDNPKRLVIDILNCVNNSKAADYEETEYYNAFRFAQFSTDPMITRMVVELNEEYAYKIATTENKLKILFNTKTGNNDSDEEDVKNTKLKTVVIDAGHGGKDPGALGLDENEKIILMEKDVNLKIALKVYNLLKKEDLNVYITRKKDEFLELSEIVAFANSKEADLLVSIHNNAAENPETYGTMTMYAYDDVKEGHDMSGKELATIIQKHMVKATKSKNYGPVKNSALYIIRKANMPAVITESLFITNEEDREKLMSDDYIEEIAVAIYKGIMEAVKLL